MTDLISYFVYPYATIHVSEAMVKDALWNQGFNLRAPSMRSRTTGTAVTFWKQRLVWRQFDYLRERLVRI